MLSQQMQELEYERETERLKHKWRLEQIEKEKELEQIKHDLRVSAAKEEAKTKGGIFR